MPALSKMFTTRQISAIREKLIKDHGNMCQICKKPREAFKKNLSVDHNHKSGRIRGLLCYRCNKFQLGRHSIESVKALLDYLEKFDLPLENK